MSVSVIVPALITGSDKLAMSIQCIEKARALTEVPFELIVVETGTDFLKEYADTHIYEKNVTNATKSINRGFKIAHTEYIVLLTNDVMVEEGWLEALLKPFEVKEDCGITTLATSQFGHEQQDLIEEGVWFSVACFKKRNKYFDESSYCNVWDDTDFIMRHYLEGKKMYRNYNVVVDHLVGETQYAKEDHEINFDIGRDNFIKKYELCGHEMFDKLISGEVI